jgi:hypothetical protein
MFCNPMRGDREALESEHVHGRCAGQSHGKEIWALRHHGTHQEPAI